MFSGNIHSGFGGGGWGIFSPLLERADSTPNVGREPNLSIIKAFLELSLASLILDHALCFKLLEKYKQFRYTGFVRSSSKLKNLDKKKLAGRSNFIK